MDFETATLDELHRMKEELRAREHRVEAAIAERRKRDILALQQETRQKCAALGITLEDLLTPARPKPTPARPDSRHQVKPKYRDPVSGKTWSGRGVAPSWLQPHLAPYGTPLTGEARETALAKFKVAG